MEGALLPNPAVFAAAPPLIANRPAFAAAPPVIQPPSGAPFRVRPLYVILIGFACLPLVCVLGIASYFHLSSANQALRRDVMEAVPGHWDKRVGLSVGPLTLGLARLVTSFVKLPPEAHAALASVHGADVGVYHRRDESGPANYAALFKLADKSMRWRGWERIVGVAQEGQCVAVYAPRNLHGLNRMACCVVVLDHQDLVVVSARGNLEPILDLPQVRDQLAHSGLGRMLARN